MRTVGMVIGVIALLVLMLVGFGMDWATLRWEGFIGPKRANVRREIFEQTKSFTDSKRQDLIRYRLQFMRADSVTEKQAIASAVRQMMADVDETKLSPELGDFLSQMRSYVGVE